MKPGSDNNRRFGLPRNSPLIDGSTRNQHVPTDFGGMNLNIYVPIRYGSANLLGYPESFGVQSYVNAGDEGSDATLNLIADQGDDNDDKWQLDATTGGEFFLRSWGAGGLNTAWYASYNSTLSNPIFHGPIGGIDFSANQQATSTDIWNQYSYDGHLHRTAGQAYITICLLYTSPSPRDQRGSGMASWA